MTLSSIQYVNDSRGSVRSVQLPVADWRKILSTLRKYEQALQVKSDLVTALSEVRAMQSGKMKKRSLVEFLNGL